MTFRVRQWLGISGPARRIHCGKRHLIVRIESRRPGRLAGTVAKNSKNHPIPIRKFPNSLPGWVSCNHQRGGLPVTGTAGRGQARAAKLSLCRRGLRSSRRPGLDRVSLILLSRRPSGSESSESGCTDAAQLATSKVWTCQNHQCRGSLRDVTGMTPWAG